MEIGINSESIREIEREHPTITEDDRPGRRKARRCFEGALDRLAEVRRFVRLAGEGHGATNLVELVASELAANSVLHSDSGKPGGRFTVEVEFAPDEAIVAVTDLGAEHEPTARCVDAEAVSGRGLWMVEMLSLAWGSESTESGRRIWAVLPASPDDGTP